jgi:hypothetical protein
VSGLIDQARARLAGLDVNDPEFDKKLADWKAKRDVEAKSKVESAAARRRPAAIAAPTPAEITAAAGGDHEWAVLLHRACEMLGTIFDTKQLLSAGGPDKRDMRPLGKTLAEMRACPAPAPRWLARNLITAESVCAISSEPKSAKTWLGGELALSMASGTPAAGAFAVDAPCSVLYLFAEDDQGAVQVRFEALAKSKGLDPGGQWIHRLAAEPSGRALDLRHGIDLCTLVASVWRHEQRTAQKVGAVFLDPLSDLHSGKENERDSMAPLMRALRKIAKQILKCSIVFVHHSAKSNAESKSRRQGQKMRGSSAIHGAVDCGIYLDDLRGDGKTEFVNRMTSEVKSARGAGVVDLTLRIVDDADGHAQTATFTTSERVEKSKSGPTNLPELRAVTVVEKLFEQGGPLTFDKLKVKIGGGNDVLQDAISIGERKGWIAQRMHKGHKAGYEITDAGRELYRDGHAQVTS